MLKALELAGFKSFADSTRFEFPAGITVVVGPNGSGKSNIVDAIKWVFGEQSVKSLRGTEMVDVVFNGSATRPASQTAEATLVLENVDGRFPVDTREVEVTRRVYRSGEGEYLINRQPCRRKDIVELFAGTGIGTHAYCIIEQGKVDLLLQSSPKDRRIIFEEAAGISRFKAKKLETQRRLERVEQNLARLSDIVQEVEGRLKAIRLQAGKAAKYREYSERLQSLRTQAASMDWRNLNSREEEAATRRTAANAANEEVTARLERVEARGLELDVEVTEVTRVAREAEARASKTRELIAAREAGLTHERNRITEATREVEHWKQELEVCQKRLSELSQAENEAAKAVRVAERDVEEGRGEIDAAEEELKARQGALDAAKAAAESVQRDRLELLESIANCGQRLSQAEARHEAMRTMASRLEEQLRDWERQVDRRRLELDNARGEVARIQADIEAVESELGKLESQVSAQRSVVGEWTSQLSDRRRRHGVDSQRATFLEEMEQRQEGIHVAVREVLARAKSAGAAAFPSLHGLIADLFRVQIDTAPLIEIALGERAQYLVVERRQALLDYLSRTAFALQGRVGFAWLDARPPSKSWYGTDWTGQEGVVGRADRLVDVDTQYVALASRLLGRTWIVRDLAIAEELLSEASPGTRFVTGLGELLDAEVGLVVGPRQAATGIISRRSESRELRLVIAQHIKAIERLEKEEQSAATTLGERVASLENCRLRLGEAQLLLREERSRCQGLERRLDEQEAERTKLERHLAEARETLASAKVEIDAATKERRELGRGIDAKRSEIEAAAIHVTECESRREEWLRGRSAVELAIAGKQHQLALEWARHAEAARQLEEARAAAEKMNSQLGLADARVAESERKVADHEVEIERLIHLKESHARESIELVQRRDALESELRANSALAKELHAERRRTETTLHEVELSLRETRQKRLALEERFLEECGIDLTILDGDDSTTEELAQRDEMDREIEVLRRKLNSLGNINMEALSELDSLETRFAALSGQYDDLHKAKLTLEQIIHRINADSRRMFAETLATIRGHFEDLYRRLFGGGIADIVLEEGVDILESGIEIVARPPGKQLRGVSLLSGGEKTLTCVALLLAFFKSRPSPFCVLDEVDAALDEANIGRFISVIQGFLTGTQFIVVTHSKKTMGAADTLYGVTMQESGVSRRVSVRFADVAEDGAIVRRSGDERAKDETDAA